VKKKFYFLKVKTEIVLDRILEDNSILSSLRVNSSYPLEDIKKKIEEMIKIKYAYIITGEYPIFIMAKCLDHSDSMELIEKLRNLPGVEEIKTQIVLDKIKEDPSVIIP